MAGEIDKTIEENAKGPKRARGDSCEMKQHSLADQIAADRYLASKKAAKAKRSGLRITKLVPSGSE